MNSKKRLPSLVFFGTPEFARYCLETLLEAGFPVQGVVTAPDRKAGRGKEVRVSAVKFLATAKGLPLLQPTNLKDPEFITELQSLEADVQIVVAFRMLPRVVWELPELGTINLHASLLPNFRGAAPINWVLIEGEHKTGVTTFLINEQIDTGAILKQREIEIAPTDDAGTLHDKLLRLGAPLIVETLKDIYAYLKAIGKATPAWEEHVYQYQYDLIFLVTPWRDIYTKDAQRLETFEQAEMYYPFIKEVYSKQHKIIEVPQLNLLERISFIESYIKSYG